MMLRPQHQLCAVLVNYGLNGKIRDDNICCFNYREQNDIASFFSMTKDDYATNILSIKCSVSSPLKELVDESNEWYNKIVAIKAQKEQIRNQR